MANCPSYGCSDLVDYDPGNACLTYKGGANQILFIKCDSDIDDESTAEEIETAITNGDAILIENIKLNWDAPSPVTVDPLVGCLTETVAAYDHSVTMIDRNVTAATIDWYNSANASTGFTFGSAMVWECDAQRVTYIDVPLQMQGGRVFPDQNNALQNHAMTLTFRSTKGAMPIIATPAGIFN